MNWIIFTIVVLVLVAAVIVLMKYQQPEVIKFCQDAGFKKIDIFFKWFNFVGIIAIK